MCLYVEGGYQYLEIEPDGADSGVVARRFGRAAVEKKGKGEKGDQKGGKDSKGGKGTSKGQLWAQYPLALYR